MSKKLTIYFICGAGLGSSLACQMTAEDVLNRLGLEENLEHEAISSTSLFPLKILPHSLSNTTLIRPLSLYSCITLSIPLKLKPNLCPSSNHCQNSRCESQSAYEGGKESWLWLTLLSKIS